MNDPAIASRIARFYSSGGISPHDSPARVLNATTTRSCRCAACGDALDIGVRVLMRRERARSLRHAQEAGHSHPWRVECAACVGAWNAVFALPEGGTNGS